MDQSNRLRLWAGVLVVPTVACREATSEPEGAPAIEAVRSATVQAPPAPAAPLPSASARRPVSEHSDAGALERGTTPWSRCATGFHPRSTPDVDVFRLGVLCGPSNGMVRWGPALTGWIGEDGQEGQHTMRVEAGDCVRFAVVAGEDVEDLEVEIGPVAGGSEPVILDRRWALVPAQEPLCVRSAVNLTVMLRTHAGAGPYAVAGWRRR
jgi:hypothetical protein